MARAACCRAMASCCDAAVSVFLWVGMLQETNLSSHGETSRAECVDGGTGRRGDCNSFLSISLPLSSCCMLLANPRCMAVVESGTVRLVKDLGENPAWPTPSTSCGILELLCAPVQSWDTGHANPHIHTRFNPLVISSQGAMERSDSVETLKEPSTYQLDRVKPPLACTYCSMARRLASALHGDLAGPLVHSQLPQDATSAQRGKLAELNAGEGELLRVRPQRVLPRPKDADLSVHARASSAGWGIAGEADLAPRAPKKCQVFSRHSTGTDGVPPRVPTWRMCVSRPF